MADRKFIKQPFCFCAFTCTVCIMDCLSSHCLRQIQCLQKSIEFKRWAPDDFRLSTLEVDESEYLICLPEKV